MIRKLLLSLFAFSFMIAAADATQMTPQAATEKPAVAIEAAQVVTGRSAWHHWHHWHRHWHPGWHRHYWHRGWYHPWHPGWYRPWHPRWHYWHPGWHRHWHPGWHHWHRWHR